MRAEAGDAAAQYDLGVMYANGLGVPEDDAEAVRWLRLAADQGRVNIQFLLGSIYETGRGVRRQNYVQAHMWYNLAASRLTGKLRDNAVGGRDAVAGLMNPTQIAEAQRFAGEWDAAHPREP